MGRPTSTKQLSCSFCGLSQSAVAHLIAGPPGHFICNECVELCQEILNEKPLEGARDMRRAIKSPRTPLRILDRAAASHFRDDLLCSECETLCALNILVFAADKATSAESSSVSHAIAADEISSVPRLCLACAQNLLLSSLEKRECALCHQSRLVSEFPDSEMRVCVRCAQTAVWLLEHRDSEPDVLMAMHALLAGGMHALFDYVVRLAKHGHLHRSPFENMALQVLRRVGLIPKNEFHVPEGAVGFIADSCHTDGVWLRVQSERVPEANIEFTPPVL